MNYKSIISKLSLVKLSMPTWSGKDSSSFVKYQEVKIIKPVTQHDSDLNEDVTANPGEIAKIIEISGAKIAIKFPDYEKLFYVQPGDIEPVQSPQQALAPLMVPASGVDAIPKGSEVESLVAQKNRKTGESIAPGDKGVVTWITSGRIGVRFSGKQGLFYFTNDSELTVIKKPKSYAAPGAPAKSINVPFYDARPKVGEQVLLTRTIHKKDGTILRSGTRWVVRTVKDDTYDRSKMQFIDSKGQFGPANAIIEDTKKVVGLTPINNTPVAGLSFVGEKDLQVI